MGQSTSIPWDIVAQGLFAFSVCAVVVGVISSRVRERAGGYWILGWAALLLTGTLYLVADAGYPIAGRVAFITDAMLAPMMFMGAAVLKNQQSQIKWPLLVGVGAGCLRIGLVEGGWDTAHAIHGAVIAPVFFAAAAFSTLQAPKQAARFRLPIATLLVVFAVFEVLDAYFDWANQRNVIQWRSLILIGVPLAALQIASRLSSLRHGLTSAQAAGALAEQERDLERWRFEVLFEHAHELVAELDADMKILFVNARVKAVLGLDPSALIGMRAMDFIHEEGQLPAAEQWQRQVEAGGLEAPVTFMLPSQAGTPVFLEISVSDYAFPGETRFLVIARDITDRMLAERELKAEVADSAERLEASRLRLRDQERLATVGTLASGIAHQINNPIGAISAAAEFALISRGEANAVAIHEESLTHILEEAQRAGRIVRSVLRFARHGSASKWTEDLGPVVRRAAELVRPYVVERGGSLDLDLSAESCLIKMSPIEIEQSVVNLVRNAAESREHGAQIRVTTVREATCIYLEVADDGRGISADEQALIFDPFYTTRLREGGSGLGLSVVHGVVIDHGGQIEVESQIDRGTQIRLSFPSAA